MKRKRPDPVVTDVGDAAQAYHERKRVWIDSLVGICVARADAGDQPFGSGLADACIEAFVTKAWDEALENADRLIAGQSGTDGRFKSIHGADWCVFAGVVRMHVLRNRGDR